MGVVLRLLRFGSAQPSPAALIRTVFDDSNLPFVHNKTPSDWMGFYYGAASQI